MRQTVSYDKIGQRRKACGLTQQAAADMIFVSRRTWINYEQGTTDMPRGLWELFKIKAPAPGKQGAKA